MERNVGESKLFKGVQVICSITALKLKVLFNFMDTLGLITLGIVTKPLKCMQKGILIG